MFLEESQWIGETLVSFSKDKISPLLNIGSSSKKFREEVQPFINENIFLKLNQIGVDVCHTDLQNDIGVDLVGDLANETFVEILKQKRFKLIICSNLMEHLELDIRLKVCKTIQSVLEEGGYLILTVPHVFPYHEDPIDTWYRPDLAQLAGLFPNFTIVEKKYIRSANSLFSDIKKRPVNMCFSFIKLFLPFYKFKQWKNDIKYFPSWFKKYEVSCLLLIK